jgi:hypothetical protein
VKRNFDAVLLDISLDGPYRPEIADVLTETAIPFAFITSYNRPFEARHILVHALQRLHRKRRSVPGADGWLYQQRADLAPRRRCATLAPGKWLWGTLAWAHRLDGGKGADISGTIIGLFGMSAPGASVAADWAEVTAGVRLPAWKNGAVTASLTASVPANFPTTYAARVGASQTF